MSVIAANIEQSLDASRGSCSNAPMAYASASEPRARADHVAGRAHWLFRLVAGLCLLEPLIGVLWQATFARAQGQSLDTPHRLLLATGLWLTYIADHWFDCRRGAGQVPRTARHEFLQRHSRRIAVMWLVLFLLQAGLASATLSAGQWLNSAVLLVCAGAYLALVRASRHKPILKEAWMALVYTGGISLFGWQALDGAALTAALSFVGLVLLNVCCIAVRERAVDRASGQTSIATRARVLGAWLAPAGWLLTALAGLGAVNGGAWTTWYVGVAGAAAASCLAHEHASRLPSDLAHLLFDACLLLPLPLLLV